MSICHKSIETRKWQQTKHSTLMPKSCLCHRKWELTGYFVIMGSVAMAFSWLLLQKTHSVVSTRCSSFKKQTVQQFCYICNWKNARPTSCFLPVRLFKWRKFLPHSAPSFQTWKQSIAVKFAFDFSTFVSSTFFISGVAIFGAVGLHRSRDELVASREKLSCSNLTELEEEHELPSISDYRFDDPSSTRSIRKTSKL
ncbi:uncharacterized protein Gasu_58200 [Galdieria sulphuraria]|uniref:Transmembrane protein n=1 Tax=Galdieria sulphuraria TaxID=130081 RepID=M2X9P8_GALSU|nr:uncharacterized protein Gasu_58200 [Galdieria sulphuraria]EME26587.1 hypothetical protein Gasu_58200 [Galdieria sulphuraria]|eukprot:XP_005703107.1 hypothetical protein Gasu_58200 [Galdieria sulphuraria]